MHDELTAAKLLLLADWLAAERGVLKVLTPRGDDETSEMLSPREAAARELLSHLGAAEVAARRLACEFEKPPETCEAAE